METAQHSNKSCLPHIDLDLTRFLERIPLLPLGIPILGKFSIPNPGHKFDPQKRDRGHFRVPFTWQSRQDGTALWHVH